MEELQRACRRLRALADGLPPVLQALSEHLPPISSQPPLLRTLRVNQLDALRLDDEISSLLRQQLAEALLWHSTLLDRFQPELDALLQAILWRYTVWIDAPTPGGQLQNVKYARVGGGTVSPEPMYRWQKLGFLGLNVLLPWLATRLRGAAEALEDDPHRSATSLGIFRRWSRAVARWYLRSAAPRVGTLYIVCAAANFVIFLRRGAFCSLGNRLLGLHFVHIDPQARRQVSFEYMNRVMMWNGLSEFLMTILPLVNLAKVRQSLTRRFFPKAMLRSMEADAKRSCCICGMAPMALPMQSDCGHVFCYFCIASEHMEHPGNVTCPYCSSRIEHIRHAQ